MTAGSDAAKRLLAIALAIVGVVLLVLGTIAFAEIVTNSFSSAGYVIVPLGVFIVSIFLLPIASVVHRLWLASDPARRAADAERLQRDHAKARMAMSAHRRWNESLAAARERRDED